MRRPIGWMSVYTCVSLDFSCPFAESAALALTSRRWETAPFAAHETSKRSGLVKTTVPGLVRKLRLLRLLMHDDI